MAVYTDVSAEELAAFLSNYDIGELLSYKGIAEGVENSNFHLQTEGGAFILTLYEKRVREVDLPFFLGLERKGDKPNGAWQVNTWIPVWHPPIPMAGGGG